MKILLIPVLILLFAGCQNNMDEKMDDSLSITQKSILAESENAVLKGKRGNGIINDWIITNSFYQDTIVLHLLDSAIDKTSYVFRFRKDHKLIYWQYNPVPRCGNGMISLDSTSTWISDSINQKITLTLNGAVSMECLFKKKIEYKIDSSKKHKLVLIKSKTYYNKRKNIFEENY